MSGKGFLAAIICVILGCFGVSTTGLQCYDCVYVAVGGGGLGELFCKYPSPPNQLAQFLVECNVNNSVVSMDSQGGIVTVADLLESGKVFPDQEFLYGCGKMRINGPMLGGWIETKRSCVAVSAEIESGCENRTVAEWLLVGGRDDWTRAIIDKVGEYEPETRVDACFCNSDECNGDVGGQ